MIQQKKTLLFRIQKKCWTRADIHQTVPVLPDVRRAQPWVNIKKTIPIAFTFTLFRIHISRLTIATELSIKANMKLIDINGIPHELTPTQVRVMMAIGWISFFLSWAFNSLFYKVCFITIYK